MKANADKCHLLLSTKEKLAANISNLKIVNSNKEKLLVGTIENHLKFEYHIESLCSKANQKLYALSRMSSYISLDQHTLIMKSFINSQLGYCSLIWMNNSSEINNKINRILELALRIVYRDKKSTVDELFQKDNSVQIHVKNLQVLITENFQGQKEKSQALMSRVFQ